MLAEESRKSQLSGRVTGWALNTHPSIKCLGDVRATSLWQGHGS